MAYCVADDVRLRTGLTTTDISDANLTSIISDVEAEIELETGQDFNNATTATDEKHGPFPEDMFRNRLKRFNLENYPVQTVTSITIINRDGTDKETLTSSDYWIDLSTGTITLKDKRLPEYPDAIKVTYTYGYATVPSYIKVLAASWSGIVAWTNVLGGKFNSLNSYSIPEQSVDKGDIYKRGLQNIENLQATIDRILDRVGRRNRVAFAASGWDSPSGVRGVVANQNTLPNDL